MELHPGDAALHAGLGDAHHLLGALDTAGASYDRALEIDRDLTRALDARACVRLAREEFAGAEEDFRRCVELAPTHVEARYGRGQSRFNLGDPEAAVEDFCAVLTASPEVRAKALQALAVAAPGAASMSNRKVRDWRRRWWREQEAKLSKPQAPPATDDRLRVGYLSSFFDRENWMKPVWGLVNAHDRDRFEVHLFSENDPEALAGSGYRDRPTDRVHDIRGASNQAVADYVARFGLDVLVDLNAFSRPARLAVLASRPARVVVGWFNHFATLGTKAVDYLIGDAAVIPPEEEEAYDEKILRVEGSYLTYSVTYPVPPARPTERRAPFTFGCLAPLYKITPQVVRAWCEILRAAPSSELLLRGLAYRDPDTCEAAIERFTSLGVERHRLRLLGPTDHRRFLETYDEIDLALDTFPYSGGTTTMEALWQGVPVLTLRGDRWVARTSESILRAAGRDDLVAADERAYVSAAAAMAEGADRGPVGAALREATARSSVCDTTTFARRMEEIYLRISRSRR